MSWHVGVIFSQRMEFIIGTPLIARYSPRSPHLLTLEIARRLEGKTALGRGEPVGGPALPFFVGHERAWQTRKNHGAELPSSEGIRGRERLEYNTLW